MIETRRKFLAQSTVFATFAISGTKSSGKIIGANERVNVAVCGIKGRGASHIGGHGRQKMLPFPIWLIQIHDCLKAARSSSKANLKIPLSVFRMFEKFSIIKR